MLMFLSGAPKAGKSVVANAMARLLSRKNESFFLERLCPDCEGNWTVESDRADLARSEKLKLKGEGKFFSDCFIEMKQSAIQGLSRRFRLVILDLGGIPSLENATLVNTGVNTGVTCRAIILRPANADISEWVQFWNTANVPAIVIDTPDWRTNFEHREVFAAQILTAVCAQA